VSSALKSPIRYFITLDKKAFKRELLHREAGFRILNPGDFMKIFRKIIGDKDYNESLI